MLHNMFANGDFLHPDRPLQISVRTDSAELANQIGDDSAAAVSLLCLACSDQKPDEEAQVCT
jgi:hypothetical protein